MYSLWSISIEHCIRCVTEREKMAAGHYRNILREPRGLMKITSINNTRLVNAKI